MHSLPDSDGVLYGTTAEGGSGQHGTVFRINTDGTALTVLRTFEGVNPDTLANSGGASPYGAFDMAGNVSEWVNDYYQSDYYRVSPALNPPGPLSDLPRSESIGIMRGGAWLNDRQSVRSAFRLGYWQRHNWYEAGFRCAMGETGQ